MTLCDLESFGISSTRGFLPQQNPLLRLPQAEFAAWEDLAQALPKYMVALSVRKTVRPLWSSVF
jgi:hypothetical protein